VRIRWTRVALADLVSARDHLALDDARAADELLRKVAAAIGKLRKYPGIGRVVPERRSLGYREVVLPPYRLVYAVVASEVQILRLWHDRRDPAGI